MVKKMNLGDKVYFEDPDEGISSGIFTIQDIYGEIYSLVSEDGMGFVEAFEHELTLVE